MITVGGSVALSCVNKAKKQFQQLLIMASNSYYQKGGGLLLILHGCPSGVCAYWDAKLMIPLSFLRVRSGDALAALSHPRLSAAEAGGALT